MQIPVIFFPSNLEDATNKRIGCASGISGGLIKARSVLQTNNLRMGTPETREQRVELYTNHCPSKTAAIHPRKRGQLAVEVSNQG